jgi:hypothetical protein
MFALRPIPATLCCLLCLLGTNASPSANASLVSADGWVVGDGLLVQDTSTGLTWLALSVTNNTSYDDIFLNDYGNLLSLGFFAPTISEVTTLFYDAGAPPGPITDNPEYSTSDFASAQAFISLFGCTAGCESGSTDSYTEGYMTSGDNGAQYAWAEIRNGTGGFGMSEIDQFSFDSEFGGSHSQVGSGFYLVDYTSDIHGLFPGSAPTPPVPAPVSEPPSYALLLASLGVFGLMARRREGSRQRVV